MCTKVPNAATQQKRLRVHALLHRSAPPLLVLLAFVLGGTCLFRYALQCGSVSVYVRGCCVSVCACLCVNTIYSVRVCASFCVRLLCVCVCMLVCAYMLLYLEHCSGFQQMLLLALAITC